MTNKIKPQVIWLVFYFSNYQEVCEYILLTKFGDCLDWRSQCNHVIIALKKMIENELDGLKEFLLPNNSFEMKERISLLELTKLE